MTVLPKEFSSRMLDLLGQSEFDRFCDSLQVPPVRAFRVNTDKISLHEFDKVNVFSHEKIPYVKNGFYLNYDKVGNHPFHHAGMIYVQDPGAMAPVECIDVQEDWCVLDMCAAPGGKSSQIKNKLGLNGILVSNEIVPSRCKILTGNIERLGFCNTITTCLSPGQIAQHFPASFDLIVVDAPCSGEGMFRKNDTAIQEWKPENVIKCAERQLDILECAISALKPGGYILYSTCTFSLEENEMVVDSFIDKHPDLELLPVNNTVRAHTDDGISFDGCRCPNIKDARRFYPHNSRGEGQFMAVMHHTGHCAVKILSKPVSRCRPEPFVLSFLDDTLEQYDPSFLSVHNKKPVYISPKFNIKDGIAFSCGVTIGELQKSYILPHHQFFMALGPLFKRKIELTPNGDQLAKYLHGEEIQTDCSNGWAVITTNGCTVGGVKVVNGRAKNHYPKGLRTRY